MLACMRIVYTWPHPINRCWQAVADKRGHSESKPQTFIVSTINGPGVRIMNICLHTPRNSHTCISAIRRVNIIPDFAASILYYYGETKCLCRCMGGSCKNFALFTWRAVKTFPNPVSWLTEKRHFLFCVDVILIMCTLATYLSFLFSLYINKSRSILYLRVFQLYTFA